MAVTFKEFAVGFVNFPGTALSRMSNIVFGHTEKNEDGKKDKETKGLLDDLFNGIKFVTKGISNFIRAHQQAISIAFWASLLVGGAVALSLFLLPATYLAAVAAFPIYGLTIAGIVGPNILMQIGLAAGLAAAAASAVTYLTAAVVNSITAISNYFEPTKTSKTSASSDESYEDSHGSARKMAHLHSESHQKTHFGEPVPPVHLATGSKTDSQEELVAEDDTAQCKL